MKKTKLLSNAITINIFIHLTAISSVIPVRADDLSSTAICNSNITTEQFIESNEDIILVARNDLQSRSDSFIVDSLKQKYPISHLIKIGTINGHTKDDKTNQIENYFWGIKKLNYKKDPEITPDNCIHISKQEEIYLYLNKWWSKNKSPLSNAILQFDTNKAKDLIKEKKYVLSNGKLDFDVMSEAADISDELPVLLLDNGYPTNGNIEDDSELPPIIIAVYHSNITLAKSLIKRKANLNYMTKESHITPLILAVLIGDAEMVELLIQAGATINTTINPLCYLDGHNDIRSKKFFPTLNRGKIAQLLLKAGANYKTDCAGPFGNRSIAFNGYTNDKEIVRAFLNAGFIPEKNKNYRYSKTALKEFWARNLEIEIELMKTYIELKESPKHIKDKKNDKNYIGRMLNLAIEYDEYEIYQKILMEIKPNILFEYVYDANENYKTCSLSAMYQNENSKYFKLALQYGVNITSDCDGDRAGSDTVLNEIIKRCNTSLMNEISNLDLEASEPNERTAQLLMDKLRNSDNPEACLVTLNRLLKNGYKFKNDFIIQKFLEINETSATEYLLTNKLVPDGALKASYSVYNEVNSQFSHGDRRTFYPKAISRQTINYYFHRLKGLNILPKQLSNKPIKFTIGKRYPLCGRNGEAGLQKRVSSEVVNQLSDCGIMNLTDFKYFEVSNIQDNYLQLTSLSSPDDREFPIGSRFYVKQNEVTTLFALEGKNEIIPLDTVGPQKIEWINESIKISGSDKFCEGTSEPKLLNPPERYKNYKLVKNHSVDFIKECTH